MTRQEQLQMQLEYAIKHEPIRYILQRYYIGWRITTINNDTVSFYFTKAMAKAMCDLLNSSYSLGYSNGTAAIINIIYK